MANATNIREMLEDIATLLLEHEQDQRETILFEELDRLCIYTYCCYAIIFEAQPPTFYNDETGEHAQTPEQLAYWILYDEFMMLYSKLIY